MSEQKKRGAIVYGDDIDPSQFAFTDSQIKDLSTEFENVRDYLSKQINQNNFQELCNAWYKIIDKVPLPIIPVDVEWILRARPNFN